MSSGFYLFHGTSARRADLIEDLGLIRCAPFGDKHVSLTTDFVVAWYFANMACEGDRHDGYVPGVPTIFSIRRDDLKGYDLLAFKSAARSMDEQEIACLQDIKAIEVPMVRWEPREFQWIGGMEI